MKTADKTPTYWQLVNQVLHTVNCKYGAPMGRANKGTTPPTVTSGKNGKTLKKNQPKIFVAHVKLDQGYDKGGAYWGVGEPLYVEFTPDLQYIHFYRRGQWHANDKH